MDFNANALTSAIVTVAEIPEKEFTWLTSEGSDNGTIYDLKICNAIPMEKSSDENPCFTIFQSNESSPMQVPVGLRRRQVRSRLSRQTDIYD